MDTILTKGFDKIFCDLQPDTLYSVRCAFVDNTKFKEKETFQDYKYYKNKYNLVEKKNCVRKTFPYFILMDRKSLIEIGGFCAFPFNHFPLADIQLLYKIFLYGKKVKCIHEDRYGVINIHDETLCRQGRTNNYIIKSGDVEYNHFNEVIFSKVYPYFERWARCQIFDDRLVDSSSYSTIETIRTKEKYDIFRSMFKEILGEYYFKD